MLILDSDLSQAPHLLVATIVAELPYSVVISVHGSQNVMHSQIATMYQGAEGDPPKNSRAYSPQPLIGGRGKGMIPV